MFKKDAKSAHRTALLKHAVMKGACDACVGGCWGLESRV